MPSNSATISAQKGKRAVVILEEESFGSESALSHKDDGSVNLRKPLSQRMAQFTTQAYGISQAPGMPGALKAGMLIDSFSNAFPESTQNRYVSGLVKGLQQFGMGAAVGSVVKNKPGSYVASGGIGAIGGIAVAKSLGLAGGLLVAGGLIGGAIGLLGNWSAREQMQAEARESQREIRGNLEDLTNYIEYATATGEEQMKKARLQLESQWELSRQQAERAEKTIAESRAANKRAYGINLKGAESKYLRQSRGQEEAAQERIGAARIAIASSGFGEGGSQDFILSGHRWKADEEKQWAEKEKALELENLKFQYDVAQMVEQTNEEMLGLTRQRLNIEHAFAKWQIDLDEDALAWELSASKRKGKRLKEKYEYLARQADSKALGALGSHIESALTDTQRADIAGNVMRAVW